MSETCDLADPAACLSASPSSSPPCLSVDASAAATPRASVPASPSANVVKTDATDTTAATTAAAHTERVSRLVKLSSFTQKTESNTQTHTTLSLPEILVSLQYIFNPATLTEEQTTRVEQILLSSGTGHLPSQVFNLMIEDSLLCEQQRLSDHLAPLDQQSFVDVWCTSMVHRLANDSCVSSVGLSDEATAALLADNKQVIRTQYAAQQQLQHKYDSLIVHCRKIEADNQQMRNKQTADATTLAQISDAYEQCQASLHQHTVLVQQLQQSNDSLSSQINQCREDQANTSALLALERRSKASQLSELQSALDTVRQLQQQRSKEMRVELKKKKDEMMMIMNSHRYQQDMKKTAARVPQLEQENQQLRDMLAALEAERSEYQRLLEEMQKNREEQRGVRQAGEKCSNKDEDTSTQWEGGRAARSASLFDDLNNAGSGSGHGSAENSAAVSRRSSGTKSKAVHVPISVRSSPRPSVLVLPIVSSPSVSDLETQLADKEKSITLLAVHRDELLSQLTIVTAEMDEQQTTLTSHKIIIETLQQEVVERDSQLAKWQEQQQKEIKMIEQDLRVETEKLITQEHQRTESIQQQHVQQITELQHTITQMEQDMLKQSSLCASYTEQLADQKQTIDSLTNSRDELMKQLRQEQVHRKEAEDRLNAQMATLALSSSEQLQQIEQQQQLIQQLKHQVEESAALLAASEQRASASTIQLSRMELLYPQALQQLESYRQEIQMLKQQLEEERQWRQRLQEEQRNHKCNANIQLLSVTQANKQHSTGQLTSIATSSTNTPIQHTSAPVPSIASVHVVPASPVWKLIPLSSLEQMELSAYATYFNQCLSGDPDLSHLLPLDCSTSELLSKLRDGLLLAKFINCAVPGTIDERVLNKRQGSSHSLPWKQLLENLTLCLSAAKGIGVTMRNTQTQTQNTESQPLQSKQTDNPKHKTATDSRPDTEYVFTPLTIIEDSADDEGRWSTNSVSTSVSVSSLSVCESDVDVDGRRNSSVRLDGGIVVSNAGRGMDIVSAQVQLADCHSPAIVIDFLYQLIKTKLFNDVQRNRQLYSKATSMLYNHNTQRHTSRERQMGKEEINSLPPEQVLLRWINYHTAHKQTHTHSTINNFGADLRSGLPYHHIIDAINQHQQHNTTQSAAVLSSSDLSVAQIFHRLSLLPGFSHFHAVNNVEAGHERLNLLLVGLLFHYSPALTAENGQVSTQPVQTQVVQQSSSSSSVCLSTSDSDGSLLSESDREERSFRMWLNSAGIPNLYVHDLLSDCRDGLLLLKLIDWIQPNDCVDWKRVELNPNNKFKSVTNCNYALHLCKQKLRLSLVGIGGEDIYDGSHKYILAVVWQLMRFYAIKKLRVIRSTGGDLTDADILDWANKKVRANPHPLVVEREAHTLKGFRDPAVTSSLFLLNLLHALDSTLIDWNQVKGVRVTTQQEQQLFTVAADPTLGLTVDARLSNAHYTISVARKLGAEVFLLPADVVECKPKMILLFVGSCMAMEQSKEAAVVQR